jgi:CheY-like chemotaxis protein
LFAPGLFDLVLTDCEMPRINGIELVQRIRRLAPEQPIGLVSAHVDKMIGSLASVSFHLDKPFLNDDLRREVKRAMELD